MEIIYLFLGILIGGIGIYFCLKPKLLVSLKINEDILKTNKEAEEKYKANLDLLDKLNIEINSAKVRKTDIQLDISLLEERKRSVQQSIDGLEDYFNTTSKLMYEKSYELASTEMELSAEKLSKKFQQEQKNAEQEYLDTLNECVLEFNNKIKNKQEELNKIENLLQDLKNKVDSAVEANKRAEELRQEKDFYKLNLSELDLQEIEHLRKVTPLLRNSEPLNKVIWKVYYEKPYTDLIGRVLGQKIHTGIYKITNIENEMCYIGQAVDIAERWKQHLKRGIGAETPTKNKLYPAMLEYGVENFTFELVEDCDKKMLNEREKYWQDFFHAKDFGYSIK